ncbi:MAG: DUF2065 domain-containing protein [Syntrophotaleaceae bacterium]
METLLTLLGLVLILEGVPWFLSPVSIRRLIRRMSESSDASLRLFGLTLMMGGLLLVYLAGKP